LEVLRLCHHRWITMVRQRQQKSVF